MILQKVDYQEFSGTASNWILKDLVLEKINLLVGKNATGKTRTINVISKLINIVADKKISCISSMYCSVEFTDNHDSYNYTINIENDKVLEEKLCINKKVMLERNDNGKGKIWYSKANESMELQVPSNKLVIVSRWGDDIQHPYLRTLYNWVKATKKYEFGKIFDKDWGIPIVDMEIDLKNLDPHEITDPIWAFLAGCQEFGKIFQDKIISFMGCLDYKLDNIFLAPTPYLPELSQDGRPFLALQVNEIDRNCILYQNEMSNGMYGAFALIILIIYHYMKKSASTILIDDIGEGLDFDRSTKLIKLLIELAEKNDNIQLIMSTNDRYVMNNVPLKYWQVIQRSGGECQVYNYQNCKEKFDEFKYMGLNNFDFLATDYINSEWKKA
jgi:energy-coupling factor transporter ATP-binding protein EcfA2